MDHGYIMGFTTGMEEWGQHWRRQFCVVSWSLGWYFNCWCLQLVIKNGQTLHTTAIAEGNQSDWEPTLGISLAIWFVAWRISVLCVTHHLTIIEFAYKKSVTNKLWLFVINLLISWCAFFTVNRSVEIEGPWRLFLTIAIATNLPAINLIIFLRFVVSSRSLIVEVPSRSLETGEEKPVQ